MQSKMKEYCKTAINFCYQHEHAVMVIYDQPRSVKFSHGLEHQKGIEKSGHSESGKLYQSQWGIINSSLMIALSHSKKNGTLRCAPGHCGNVMHATVKINNGMLLMKCLQIS